MGNKGGVSFSTDLFYDCPGPLSISNNDVKDFMSDAEKAYITIKDGESPLLFDDDNLMTGWINLPAYYIEEKKDFLKNIKIAAEQFNKNIDVYVSIGTGGSYLGIEAVINALLPDYYNQLTRQDRNCPEIYFVGNHMDSDSIYSLLRCFKDKQIGINVISKSGTTTETAVAFRILKNFIKQQQSSPEKFTIITTNKSSGSLRKLIKKNGFNENYFSYDDLEEFVIPPNIGGRFSITSPVGLFGMAAAGIDITGFIKGAYDMQKYIDKTKSKNNPAILRAALRTAIQSNGVKIENIVSTQKALYGLCRWSRQLWPESEGKQGKGLWVSHGFYTEDAHSIGQLISDGQRNLIETFLTLEKPVNEIPIPRDKYADDGLEHLSETDKNVSFINDCAVKGLMYDHYNRGVPIFEYKFSEMSAYNLGQFFQCEMNACLTACVMQGINAVTQPGVEGYKNAMFALSGKPGYEGSQKEIIDFFETKNI